MKFPTRTYDQDWFRMIPSRFPTIDVYERLGEQLSAAAKALEDMTNPRLAVVRAAPPAVSAGSGHQFQNWNHAPFVYKNPSGTWLVGPSVGVMEVAGKSRTALALALLRREAFLASTDQGPIDLEMRMLSNRVSAKFVDLTKVDVELEQPERWKIGEALYKEGAAGVVFRRPRFSDELFLALFDGSVLGRAIQGAHYKFVWDGSLIKTVYDFSEGVPISRSELFDAIGMRPPSAA